MKPIFFRNKDEFRKWLSKNHQTESELLVGYYKTGSGKLNMTWSESVDQALCFGWIDGVRKSIDADSYYIRFTPRKPTSIWSLNNVRKVEELMKAGLMKEAGIEAFKKRKQERSGVYSFESEPKKFSGAFEKKFKSNKEAWSFFISQAPSYQKVLAHWVLTAKQEKTRESRLDKAILASLDKKRLF
jgi:uncharacterized protein YdeI (YjbR/CyaY-like superfamily)